MTKSASVDFVPYTNINHEAQKMLGISNDEYCVANAIYSLSHNPRSDIPGWCYSRKEYIANSVNVSRSSVFRYVHKLIQLGLVECHPERPDLMRTTAKWYDTTQIKKVEMVVEDMPSLKTQSHFDTKSLNKIIQIDTGNPKMRQTYQNEKNQSQIDTDQSQNETHIDIQEQDNNKNKERESAHVDDWEDLTAEAFGMEPKDPSKNDKQRREAKKTDNPKTDIATYLQNPPDEHVERFTREFNASADEVREKSEDMYYWWRGVSAAKKRTYSDPEAMLRNALKKDFGKRPASKRVESDLDRQAREYAQQFMARRPQL